MKQHSPHFDRVLAHCLEAMIMEGRSIKSLLEQYPQYRDELAELLTIARTAHKVPNPPTKQTILASSMPQDQPSTKGSLVDELVPWLLFLMGQINPSHKPKLKAVSWAVAAVLVVALLAGTGVGAAYAADGASPGDPLYGLDRAAEKVRMALTFDPEHKAEYGLQLAQERLAEVQTLSDREAPLRHIYQALADHQAQVDFTNQLLAESRAQDEMTQAPGLERALVASVSQQENEISRIANTIKGPNPAPVAKADSEGAPGRTLPAAAAGNQAEQTPAENGQQRAMNNRGNSPASQTNSAASNSPGLSGRVVALQTHLNRAEHHISHGNIQAAKRARARYQQQIQRLANVLAAMEGGAQAQAMQALFDIGQDHRDQVLADLTERLPAAAQAGLERATDASNGQGGQPGGGPPDEAPGNGPPDDHPGGGPPDDVPGGGPPEDVPGNGPPDGNPGGGRGN